MNAALRSLPPVVGCERLGVAAAVEQLAAEHRVARRHRMERDGLAQDLLGFLVATEVVQRLALQLHENSDVAHAELLALVFRGAWVEQAGAVVAQRRDAVVGNAHRGDIVGGGAGQNAGGLDVS